MSTENKLSCGYSEKALTRVFQHCCNLGYYFALSILGNQKQARMALLQAYSALFSLASLPATRKEQRLLTLCMVYKSCLDPCMERPPQPESALSRLIPNDGEMFALEHGGAKGERHQQILFVLSRLSLQQRAAVVLRYLGELSLPEIVKVTGVPEDIVCLRLGAARSQIFRCEERGLKVTLNTGLLKGALQDASIRAALSPDIATEILRCALSANGLRQQVRVTSRAMAPSSFYGRTAVTLSAGFGGVTAAGIVAVSFMAPQFVGVEVSPHFGTVVPVNVAIDSLKPISEVYATTPSGVRIDLQEVGTHAYLMNAHENGVYTLVVTDAVQRSSQGDVTVTTVDRTGCRLVSYEAQGNTILLKLTDDESGIDFSTLLCSTLGGRQIEPLAVDEASGQLVLPLLQEPIQLSVKDRCGNPLDTVITLITSLS